MPVALDLQFNRRFLDTNFEGYKLDTVSLPIYIKSIPEGIDIVHPSDDQYSYIQQREFSIHNHAHNDPWDLSSIYYVDSSWKIKQFIVQIKEDIEVEGPFQVWEVPGQKSRLTGQSNVTLCFATSDIAIVSDGAGSVYVLSAPNRTEGTNIWKQLHHEEVEKPGRIVDARSPSSGVIHLLFVYVDSKHTYVHHLHLISGETDKWTVNKYHTVFGKGALDYASLNLGCSTMYIISQEELKSQDIVDEDNKSNQSTDNKISFEWQQTYEEVTVWLVLDSDCHPNVKVTPSELIITESERILLRGQLYRPIEEGLTVWNTVNGKLEVLMSKRDEGSMWPKIFEESNFNGKEIIDPVLAEEIHTKLEHLTSDTEDVGGATILNSGQLEECDITDGERRAFFVYDLSSPINSSTHRVELGSGQWLMSGPRRENSPSQFCIRSDVDGIVWEVTSEHKLNHAATFCAFGFVQASKESRIYSFFPSDQSYTGIVDGGGRVFLYRGGIRPGSRKTWGTQHVLNLNSQERVLGIHATPRHLFLLSCHHLHVIGLNFSQSMD